MHLLSFLPLLLIKETPFLHSFKILQVGQMGGGKLACKFVNCDLSSSTSSDTQNAGIMNPSEDILNRYIVNQAIAEFAL